MIGHATGKSSGTNESARLEPGVPGEFVLPWNLRRPAQISRTHQRNEDLTATRIVHRPTGRYVFGNRGRTGRFARRLAYADCILRTIYIRINDILKRTVMTPESQRGNGA